MGELFLEALGARSVALPRDQVHAWAEINDLDVAHTHLFYIESVGAQCMLGQAPRPRPRTPTLSLRQAPRIWYAGYTEWDPFLERSAYRSDLEAHPVRWGLGSLRARIPPVPRTTCRALAEAVNNPDEWAGQTFVAASVSSIPFGTRAWRRYTTPRFEAAHRLRRNQRTVLVRPVSGGGCGGRRPGLPGRVPVAGAQAGRVPGPPPARPVPRVPNVSGGPGR